MEIFAIIVLIIILGIAAKIAMACINIVVACVLSIVGLLQSIFYLLAAILKFLWASLVQITRITYIVLSWLFRQSVAFYRFVRKYTKAYRERIREENTLLPSDATA